MTLREKKLVENRSFSSNLKDVPRLLRLLNDSYFLMPGVREIYKHFHSRSLPGGQTLGRVWPVRAPAPPSRGPPERGKPWRLPPTGCLWPPRRSPESGPGLPGHSG